jgi:hypothetical protein
MSTTFVTIGSFTTNRLTAQPFGYEGDARDGLTAPSYRISGLLTASEWQDLVSVYETWRDLRIQDTDSLYEVYNPTGPGSTPDPGSTVLLSLGKSNPTAAPINGLSVSEVGCYFTEPPSGEQAGNYINATVTLVDAVKALEVLLYQEQKNQERSDATEPDLGLETFDTVEIQLIEDAATRQDSPTASLTAGGTTLLTGALKAHEVRRIRGFITPDSNGTYSDLLDWYDTTIETKPSAGDWFPIEPPSATVERRIIGGLVSVRYTVSLTLLKVL